MPVPGITNWTILIEAIIAVKDYHSSVVQDGKKIYLTCLLTNASFQSFGYLLVQQYVLYKKKTQRAIRVYFPSIFDGHLLQALEMERKDTKCPHVCIHSFVFGYYVLRLALIWLPNTFAWLNRSYRNRGVIILRHFIFIQGCQLCTAAGVSQAGSHAASRPASLSCMVQPKVTYGQANLLFSQMSKNNITKYFSGLGVKKLIRYFSKDLTQQFHILLETLRTGLINLTIFCPLNILALPFPSNEETRNDGQLLSSIQSPPRFSWKHRINLKISQ